MGLARSKMKKVAPVSVTEEPVCSGGTDRDEHLSTSNTSLIRNRTDCNSEGQESEVSAEDDTLAEVERILAEGENIEERPNIQKMPTLVSKSSGLCYAKHASLIYRGSKHDEVQHGVCEKNELNTTNMPTSNTQEQVMDCFCFNSHELKRIN